jgi:hypothetical protein
MNTSVLQATPNENIHYILQTAQYCYILT